MKLCMGYQTVGKYLTSDDLKGQGQTLKSLKSNISKKRRNEIEKMSMEVR